MAARSNENSASKQASDGRADGSAQLGRGAQVASIVAGALIALIVVVYAVGCVYFYQRFWPNTVIGDADVSSLVASDAMDELSRASDERTVSVSGQGVSFTLTGANAGLQLNVEAAVSSALAENSSWQWPYQIFREHDQSEVLSTSFDTDLLRSTIEGQLSAFNSMATDPQDAFLYFDDSSNSYQINPGSMGTKLDVESVMQTVMDALTNKQSYAALSSANLVQQSVTASDERLVNAQAAANVYLQCNLALTINGDVFATVDPATVASWVTVGADYTVSVDDSAISAWVDTLESRLDTVYQTRYYTRPDGKYVTVTNSGKNTYGWISDGAALEDIVRSAVYNGTQGSSEIPFSQTAATWAENGADWGGTWIDIDLTEQYVRYYSDYSIVWESYCVTGNIDGEHETPQGVYYIRAKMVDQTLVGLYDAEKDGPEYETFVNYWMPFIENLYALHDNPYETDDWFGPGPNTWGAGSHGCVNLPLSKAESLYSMVYVGLPVVVHY